MTSTPARDVAEADLKQKAPPFSLLVFFLIIALFAAARLWRLTTACLWFDEIFGIHAARHDWKHMLQFVAADLIHPPFFYILLKIWIAIGGDSLLWLRLLPALLSIVAIAPILLFCRALKLDRWQINLTLALLAVNGYLIKYAQEVRMYSLLFLLSCISLWLFVRFKDAADAVWRVLAALTAVNLLLVYSHYYGWVVVVIELFFMLLWHRERAIKFLLATLVLVLSYLPWLYLITISKQPGRGLAQNLGWVLRPSLKDLSQFFALLNTPFFFRQSSLGTLNDIWSIGVSLILFGAPLAWLIWRTIKGQDSEPQRTWLLLGLTVLPIMLVFTLSWILPHSVWGTRHLIITLTPYAMLAGLALSRLPFVWLRTVCLILIACWATMNGTVTLLKRPPNLTWCAWEPLAQQLAKAESANTQPVNVYAFEDLVAYHLWFGFLRAKPDSQPPQFKVHVVKGVPGLQEDPAYFLPRRFYEIETQDGGNFRGETIWLAFRDSQWNPARPPLSLIAAQGFETGRVFELRAQGQQSFLVELRRKGLTP